MAMRVLFFALLLFLTKLFVQASKPSSLTYEAGVVEFSAVINRSETPSERLLSNIARYLEIMDNAPLNLDIIVFPENTLNGIESAVETPEPEDKVAPCDGKDYPDGNLLKLMSCSARKYQRYVVVDITTKTFCPDNEMIANADPRRCTDREDGMSYYNTNVVFDRNGTLISRYRKYNLFIEPVDQPFKPLMASFETDFGVTFGHFICFDIMFRYPALELARKHISDIVFTTKWYSELPFHTAVQIQQNWAYANNVNLLAAGASDPSTGSTGTGIYAGRKGSLTSVMEGKENTNLYTATVPKRGLGDHFPITPHSVSRTRADLAPLKMQRDQIEEFNIQFLDTPSLPGRSVTLKLCHNSVCCDFTYGFINAPSGVPSYHFAAAVFYGKKPFLKRVGGVIACAILACETTDVATCAVKNESLTFSHLWHTLEIFGSFPYGDQFLYLPTTLDASIMPFGINEFSYEENSTNECNITMKSVRAIRDFYTFGIYGRDFNLDEKDSARILQTSFALVAITAFASTIKNIF